MDFVTYQITKKLKEKGFPVKGKEIIYGDNGAFVPTPTIAQVIKWLREEKKLHIEIWITGKRPIKWHHTIHTLNRSGNTQGWSSGEVCDSYEEAALSAIEFVLDNLI